MHEGEGITGLTRIIIYAGTPVVVASLRKVDDKATKELMVMFYKNLLVSSLLECVCDVWRVKVNFPKFPFTCPRHLHLPPEKLHIYK